MKHAFLSSGGRGVKQKKGTSTMSTIVNNDNHEDGVTDGRRSNVNNNDAVSMEDMIFLDAKIRDREHKMLEGKLMLVGDDGVPLKPLNVGQPTAMEPFLCFSDMFGTPNSSTKDTTIGTNDTTIKGHEGYSNGDKSNKGPASDDDRLNGKQKMERGFLSPKPGMKDVSVPRVDVEVLADNGNKGNNEVVLDDLEHPSSNGNSNIVKLDNEDNDSENDVEEDDNDIAKFMASGCLLLRQPFFYNDVKNFTDVHGGVLGCPGFHSNFQPFITTLFMVCLLPLDQKARYDGEKNLFTSGALPSNKLQFTNFYSLKELATMATRLCLRYWRQMAIHDSP
ncbi:protein argonaute 4A [Artemisia annua]|uniref:Protein argonaute 4A n=1 Tax=Artemisia annua TaxID=35608 RepID=A0A2U1L2C3_ARTAN|nr:protein argonaute 4A [Artemisia annua]